MPLLHDAHCHFFSTRFFAGLGRQLQGLGDEAPDVAALTRLGWEPPGSAAALADRWVRELDRVGVQRAALIASIPGDADSVATAVRAHPSRFVGFFMVDPTSPDADAQIIQAFDAGDLRTVCLFPAMHRFSLHDERVHRIFGLVAARPRATVFVHCGVLTVGIRGKLGLPSPFDIRYGNPLDLHVLALQHSKVPIIIPHFGAGFFREALMLADLCPNVLLDTSSSNQWIRYHPGLTLSAVFEQALAVVGPDRLIFGSDSSFFPRGWVSSAFEQQSTALDEIEASTETREKIFAGNFARLFV
jgi:predicted TIM-barrel fold metal-dependent hydrolase